MKGAIMPVGKLMANCCVISDDNGAAAVLDPGGDFDVIKNYLDANSLKTEAILLTHGHSDHIGALKELKEYTGAKVYIGSGDAYRLNMPTADVLLSDGDTVSVGEMTFRVIYTPGHTEGSVCYLCEDHMFSGDTLFRESRGRTDLPGGNTAQILESLARLAQIEENYTVIPGHGQFTSLAYEKEFNPYL